MKSRPSSPSDNGENNGVLLLRAGALPAVLATVLLVVAGLTVSSGAALSAALGAVLTMAALSVGPLLMRFADDVAPVSMTGLAITGYVVAIVVTGTVFALVSGMSWLHGGYASGGVLAALVTWLIGLVRATARLRIPAFGDQQLSREGDE